MNEELAPGIKEMAELQQAGFAPGEIDQWKAQTVTQLEEAGFSTSEVDDYFGVKNPDMNNVKTAIQGNISAKAMAQAPAPDKAAAESDLMQPEKPLMKEADSFIEALEAGFDMSVVGLMQGRPDTVLPEHAPMFYRIASQVSMMAGDIPAMIAGGIGGGSGGAALAGAAGSVVPVAGTAAGIAVGGTIGTGAGAMALPEAIRTVMMEHYEKGDVQSFSDFWERTSAVFINSLKAGVIGGVTAGVGGKVATIAAKSTMPVAAKTTAQLMSEVTTMTMVGSALEGKLPEPSEFLDASVLVLGMHGAGMAGKKIRNMYAKGNVTPLAVVEHAQQNPKLQQEIAAVNVPTPKAPELGLNPTTPKPPENIPTVKPLREANPNLSPEVNSILGKVSEQGEKTKKSLTLDQVYTNLVDKLDPINKATKILSEAKELPADANPYVLARVAVDAPAKAKHFFENGVLDYKTLENKGGSLKSALQSVESVETLEAYMISKRVIEKNAQGKPTGFDLAAAEKVVADHGAKYEAAAKQVTEFSNNVLKYAADAGVISKDSMTRMLEANKDYVPFKRIMDVEDATVGSSPKRQGKAGSLKEFKGSDRSIQSPILSIVENTLELTKMAETNRPKQALVALAAKTEGQQLLKAVPDRMEPIKVNATEIIKGLEAQGATTLEKIKKDFKEKGLNFDDETLLKAFEKEDGIVQTDQIRDITVWRKQQKDLAPNQFNVYVDGKRKVFETTPDLAEALKRLDGDATASNLLFKMANAITTVKKFGITFTPDFIIKNFFRDNLTASTFSKSKTGINPLEVVTAMGDIWKKNETYYDWLKSGGANGAFLEMGQKYVTTDIYKLQKDTNFMGSARNVIEKPIEVMRVAAELSEQSLRLAEFKKVRQSGGSVIEGGFASREITVDFQRVGAKISALNSITAFMNVSIQGLDRTTRAFKADPTGVATKSLAYITVPSMLLWYANKDDQRYQEIPRWEKDLFWIIPTDNWQKAAAEEADGLPDYMVRQTKDGSYEVNKGVIYRLPKPQELGVIFGSLPERALDAFFSERPGAFKNFEETMGELITPSFVPDAVAPAVEQYFNKSFFTGRDIIPAHLKGVLPEYQFTEYTSETAKSLGKLVGNVNRTTDFASPMVLQNYIQSWGGALGKYAVQIADKGLIAAGVAEDKVKPTSTLSDIPFIKSFVVRYPMAGTESVQTFQDSYKENKQILDTIRHLAKEGDFKNMEKELVLNSNQDNLVQLDGINEALKNQSSLIRLVTKNPDMTPDDKRQIIDSTYLMMTESAKQGNILMQEIKKQLGE